MAIHNNIERCSDGCRTSLLIAGVVLVPAIFHTSLPPCHPYITIHFMEMIFSTCSTNCLIHVYVSHIKRAVSIVSHIQIPTRSWVMMFHCVHTWLNIFIYLLSTKQS